MHENLYINPIYWLLAFLGLCVWARFCTFVSRDVQQLRSQNIYLWKGLAAGSLALVIFLWLVLPSFWLALLAQLLICGGVLAFYWMVRVKELGPEGHLF